MELQNLSGIPHLASASLQDTEQYPKHKKNYCLLPLLMKTHSEKTNKKKNHLYSAYLCVRPKGVYFLHHPLKHPRVLKLRKYRKKANKVRKKKYIYIYI